MLYRVAIAAGVMIAGAMIGCSAAEDLADAGETRFTVGRPDASGDDASADPRAPQPEADRGVATRDGGARDSGREDGGPGPADGASGAPDAQSDSAVDARVDPRDEDGGVSSDAGVTDPPPMDCSGKPGAPGTTTRMYNGRAYIVHVPPNASANSALPVVFAFHGAGGQGSDMLGTGLDILGDIDRERVFATGFSMGGYFSHHIGCQRGGSLVRAVAPHSGGTYAGQCPGAPVPVLVLHGDSDPLINVRCAEQARDLWVERNGCAEDVDVIDVMGGRCEWHRACPANGDVVLCTFDGLEHNWAFPPDYDHSSLLLWAFFERYL